MGFFKGIGVKLLAGLGLVLGVLVFVGRIFKAGENAQKAETIDKQRDIEHDTREALNDEKRKSNQSLDQARTNADSGDFSDFNND